MAVFIYTSWYKGGYNGLIRVLFSRAVTELLKICKYILENFAKRFIKPSLAAFAAPILFACKANKKLRFYINYQYLNTLIKKD